MYLETLSRIYFCESVDSALDLDGEVLELAFMLDLGARFVRKKLILERCNNFNLM